MDTIHDEGLGASPQAEDGHINIANEIAEALARVNISACEYRILWVLWRKTYGWHKKTDRISVTQFEKMTGMDRRNVVRTLSRLIKRKIIVKIDNSFIKTYGFQKDYSKWKNRGERAGVGAKLTMKPLSKETPTKEIPKEIYVEGSDELRLATLLLEEIKKNKANFKEPNLQIWARDIDLMLRKDNRSAEAIERVIRWVQSDHGDGTGRWKGWAANILSPGKLREKFDELEMKMEATNARKSKSSW